VPIAVIQSINTRAIDTSLDVSHLDIVLRPIRDIGRQGIVRFPIQ